MVVVFYVAAGLCTTLAGSEAPYLTIPSKALGAVMGAVAGESPGSGGEESYWPNALTTVSELLQPQLWTIARSLGGMFFFLWGAGWSSAAPIAKGPLALVALRRAPWWHGALWLLPQRE